MNPDYETPSTVAQRLSFRFAENPGRLKKYVSWDGLLDMAVQEYWKKRAERLSGTTQRASRKAA